MNQKKHDYTLANNKCDKYDTKKYWNYNLYY